MARTLLLTTLLVALVATGSGSAAWAAQLDATIDPNKAESKFEINYQKTVFIEYHDGGQLFDLLRTKSWDVSGTADSSNSGVQDLMANLNDNIIDSGSTARVSDLDVEYEFTLTGRQLYTSLDYKVVLTGMLTDYVITEDSQRSLVDLGWRGLSAKGPVVINDVEMNIPLSLIESQEPDLYNVIAGTDAEGILRMELINGDFILEQPMTNWHFLFDPTGIGVDAGTFGLDESIAGFVVSSWTMGESSIREGIQTEKEFKAEIVADERYVVSSVQSADSGKISFIGFGVLDTLDDLEIAGVTPTPPPGFSSTATGDFPVFIIYGMAGVAAIGGIAFFFYSNRALKHEKEGQQGISPDHLVGYQTSSSAGGYQTNRGEAQLRDSSDYAQTRSVYESSQQAPPPSAPQPEQPQIAASQEDATCGCAASADMGSECDCAMQGTCLCDATCACKDQVCIEHASAMR